MICRPEEEDDTAVAGAVDFKRKEVSYMPGFDGTGPAGMGPMTGGGRGVCNPYSASYWPYAAWQPGAQGPAYGPAFGWGPGFGRGRRFGGGITLSPPRRGVSPDIGGVVLEIRFTDRFPSRIHDMVRTFNLR